MPIRKCFFDWKRPALRMAAGFLWEQYGRTGTLDLSRVIVAVPGGRAGRLLLQALVFLAEEHGAALTPPQIVTAGELPELLYELKKPFAGELAQRLAWVEALGASPPADVERIVRRLPADEDLAGWLSLGQMLSQLHTELAADGLDFADVVERGRSLEGFGEAARWQALAQLQRHYLQVLDELGLWDRQTARLFAIENRQCRSERDIVLLATVDMDRAQRQMLDLVADRVTALVFAARALEQHFDEHGCLAVEAWRTMPVPLERDQIELADGPAEQADMVLRVLASWSSELSAEQITLGVPDQRVVPYLEERLAEAGVAARFGAGTPLARSGPVQLLAAVAEYLDAGRYEGLAALVRHPDVGVWLERQGLTDDPLSALDKYYSQRLPAQVDDAWPGDFAAAEVVRRVAQAVGKLVKPLTGKPRPLGDWAAPIVGLLQPLYGDRELDQSLPADRLLLKSCEAVLAGVNELSRVPDRLALRVTGSQALRLVLDRLSTDQLPAVAQPGAIELLGWLELPLDEAPALVVVGMNEGIVPSSRSGDLFLPDRLRQSLELEDNARRLARDNYALNVLVASRVRLRLIAGRRTAQGDPLSPSRLLFACGERERAERARALFGTAAAMPPLRLPHSPQPGKLQTELPIPRPRRLAQPITSLKVTQFRDYLACPYRFYLRHCLRLEPLDDAALELGPAAFGNLMHEVLVQFARGPLVDGTNPDLLAKHLDELLDVLMLNSFGAGVLAAVRIQAEQIRLRLRAFAEWQATWRQAGWQIRFAEQGIDNGAAALTVDGLPMVLRGRIDRIDVNERERRTVVFDYKTADAARPPDKTHREAGNWIDLQLPLYRHLVPALGIKETVELGYIVLPKDPTCTGPELAAWTADDLAAADERAFEVVRGIREQRFWPPAADPQRSFAEFAAICQEDRFGMLRAAVAEADEEDA